MSLTGQAAEELAGKLSQKYASSSAEIWITPSFTHIRRIADAVEGSRIKVGAQNAHWEQSGAFTGELSCSMLKECGADYVIIGHSERRQLFGETDETACKRADAVLSNGMGLIFCIGETLQQREAGETDKVIARQLQSLPKLAETHPGAEIIIAYEPVWAIGTGRVASLEEIDAAHLFIIKFWAEKCSIPVPRILYGGSVNGENAKAISGLQSVDGALIGGASTSLEKFSAIIDHFA